MSLPVGVKIDCRQVRYPVVRIAFDRLQITPADGDPSALMIWWDGLMRTDDFAFVYPHQRVNKIPGMDAICYKTTFFQGLIRMKCLHPGLYTFFPTTYQLPFQFGDFQREHLRLCSEWTHLYHSTRPTITWIVKPRCGSCGNGIRLVQSSFDVANQTDLAVVQRYVSPYLLNGYKFDFRFYVLISTLEPLTIYLYNEGLARFCTHLYVPPTRETLADKYCHLTNTAVNVTNPQRSKPILEFASAVLASIARTDARGARLWPRIRQVVLLSVVAHYETMIQNVGLVTPEGRRQAFPGRDWKPPQKALNDLHRYFHILGIDIMIDDRCEPVVLEINDRPSMSVTYEIEEGLKSGLVYDALNIVTVDGDDPGEKAKEGGWEKLLPGPMDSMLARVVAQIIEKSCKGKEASAKRLIAKRLGYVPSGSFVTHSYRRMLSNLPPLHS